MKTFIVQLMPSTKKKFYSLILVGLFLSTFALKAQTMVERTVQPFTKLEILGSVNVYYTHSDTLGLKIYAVEKQLSNTEISVDESRLTISNKGGSSIEPVKIYIKNNSLSSLACNGATSFKCMNQIKCDSLFISVSGSAGAKVKAETRSIRSIQSGASQLNLSGTSTNLFSDLSGASSLSAYNLISEFVKVSTTGASSAKVYSNKKVMANASGASSIKIKGDLKDISAEASTSSSITRIVDKDEKSNDAEGDSVIYRWKGKKIIVIDKDDDHNYTYTQDYDDYFNGYRHWAGFMMGVNGYVSADQTIQMLSPYQYMNLDYAKSFNYQFNLFEGHINLIKRKLLLVTGFGFDYHSYQLENNTRLNADSSFTWGVIDTTNEYAYKKNRYRNTYIQVPLLLEFNGNSKSYKCFHIAVGVIGQFEISSRTKQVVTKDNYTIDNVRKDAYNTNPFAAKAHINLGYARWTFYGEYSLTTLFQKNKGPVLYPFAVGLRLIPFG